MTLAFSLTPFLTVGSAGLEASHINEGSALRQLQYGALFALAFWLVWRRPAATLMQLRAINPFLIVVLCYCVLSMLWSVAPMTTFKRVVLQAGLLLTAMAIAPPVVHPRHMLRTVKGTLTVLLAVSCVVALIFPKIGVTYELGGAWRGIMWQKNDMGSVAGFASMLWLRDWLTTREGSWRALLALVFCLFMLVMAKSATSLLVTIIGMTLYLLLRRRLLAGRHAGALVFLALALPLLYAFLGFFLMTGRLPQWSDLTYAVTAWFDKSPDLTGRGDIWDLIMLSIAQHPLLGAGYAAFWLDGGGPAEYIGRTLGWMPTHAHNGFVDILNELGGLGLVIVLAMLAWHMVSIARLALIDRDSAAMHASIFAVIVISNFSESSLLRHVAFPNILFMLSSLAITSQLACAQRAAPRMPAQSSSARPA
ncbi:O-antigen ligase family protein [Pigmentiphaga humi]|uniref:O-antigen ligase family protein n=1 Tax=Pigmentiphaga humi TaxID=2478468 RepID=UPI001358C822|nr:O-antigen ligase family protein [Pigmentiphaga humi]